MLQKLDKNQTEEGFTIMMGEVDEVFEHFNAQQMSIVKQAINIFLEGGSFDLSELQRVWQQYQWLLRC